jgi:hypothetical protein
VSDKEKKPVPNDDPVPDRPPKAPQPKKDDPVPDRPPK